jgi:CMP-N-acetylneuraminic acid synthetase
MRVLGIIPARGGSKGVPGKNIKLLNGQPLINYTIEVAQKATKINRLVVNSDSDEILYIASQSGVNCSKRPPELATDTASIVDAILYELQQTNEEFDYVILLQPTSPFRTPHHLDEAIDAIIKSKANSLISVTEMDDVHPARMYNLADDGNTLESLFPLWETARRQDIPPVYYRNGSIYITKTEALLQSRSVMCSPSVPYIMDKKYLANIDDERDWIIAEAILANHSKQVR